MSVTQLLDEVAPDEPDGIDAMLDVKVIDD
jgi:hypothetical protein